MQMAESIKSVAGFEQWHQLTCRNFSLTECSRIAAYGFHAQIMDRQFGPLVVSDTSSATGAGALIRLTRGHDEIRKDARDHLMLLLMKQGEITLAQDGRVAKAKESDLVVYDQARPFTLQFSAVSASIVVTIPRSLLEARISGIRDMSARRIAGTSNFGLFAATVVRQMIKLDGAHPRGLADRLGISAVDMICATLEAELAGSGDLSRERRLLLDEIKRFLLDNLGDCDLDIETIASAHNVAARTLNRLFAAEGTTPIRWLWQQRLAASYKALAEGRVDRVTDAAFDFGFSDVAHFSRAFKQTFGRSPQTLIRGGGGRGRMPEREPRMD